MVAAKTTVCSEPRCAGAPFHSRKDPPAFLVLEDGAAFPGVRIGARDEAGGEVVFTTSMTGYQEVISDPSYRGQIVVMAYPLIGNYGCSEQAWEATGPHVRGFIVRESCDVPSHYLSANTLHDFLASYGISGLAGVDTRRLVRHLRVHGLKRGIISDRADGSAVARARRIPVLDEQDLVGEVSRQDALILSGSGPRIALLDCGVKTGIIDALRRRECEIVLLPHATTAETIEAFKPDGVLLSNGPGDPAVLPSVVNAVRMMAERTPTMGICLGHQLLALALGGRTYKMKFGHRGSNHPVRDQTTGRVMITTQNHGYAVEAESLPAAVEVTHINLHDGTVEGLRHCRRPVFSVQFHPEGRPGPPDAEYLYDQFLDLVREPRGSLAEAT